MLIQLCPKQLCREIANMELTTQNRRILNLNFCVEFIELTPLDEDLNQRILAERLSKLKRILINDKSRRSSGFVHIRS